MDPDLIKDFLGALALVGMGYVMTVMVFCL